MSDDVRPNYQRIVDQYILIAKREYPNIPHDLIEEAAIGSLVLLANGGNPSTVLSSAAYDLGIAPYASYILEFAFRKVK